MNLRYQLISRYHSTRCRKRRDNTGAHWFYEPFCFHTTPTSFQTLAQNFKFSNFERVFFSARHVRRKVRDWSRYGMERNLWMWRFWKARVGGFRAFSCCVPFHADWDLLSVMSCFYEHVLIFNVFISKVICLRNT